MRARCLVLGGVLGNLVLCSAVLGQVIRQGSEFQVNIYTTNSQSDPSVALDADGDFVVTWTSATQEANGNQGIFGARFNSAGTMVGVELHVNTFTSSVQHGSSVAAEANGDFVVVWQSFGQSYASSYSVFGQRFSSSGSALGTEFQVNSYTLAYSFRPRVAVDDDGDFVVVWQSNYQDGSDGGIFGQRFSSSGAMVGGEFRANSHTPDSQRNPAVAIDSDGDFVVTWDSAVQDGQSFGVFAQRFDSAGAQQGSEFQVHSYTTNNQSMPAVAADADGDFLVSWQSLHQDGPLPNEGSFGVFARRFTSNGVAQAIEFQVNVFTTGYQRFPRVAADGGGNFVVVWESSFQDGLFEGVFARRVTGAGVASGPEFQANSWTVLGQREPVIDFDSSGDFVIAWWTDYPQDGSGYGVFAQRFSLSSQATLDIDGNGSLNALTDGLLYLRYRFGLTGTALVASAVGAGCSRCDGAAVVAYLDGLGTTLDVDGNGSFSALTDGLLVVRFLFNLSGTALTNGVVGAGCTRCDAAAIVPYLQTLD